jgi:prepilin-type N-terminal cleavage/methylation domain-containing protein
MQQAVSRTFNTPLPMKSKMKSSLQPPDHRGFTLIEIMLVVAIIGLLATISVPSYIRARKRSQAVVILDSARALDAAISLYTVEHHRVGSQAISTASIADFLPYIKTDTAFYSSLPNDLLGNPFTLTTLDETPKISDATFATLSDAAPLHFWSPYYP